MPLLEGKFDQRFNSVTLGRMMYETMREYDAPLWESLHPTEAGDPKMVWIDRAQEVLDRLVQSGVIS